MRAHAEASWVWSAKGNDREAGKTRRAVFRRVFALIAVLSIALLVPTMAEAATSYRSSGAFATASPFSLQRMAVDEGTGNVLVSYEGGGILVYGPDGAGDTPIAEIGGISSPQAIAIDQSNGDLYVSSANGILRYTTDRANPPTYTLDASYTGPAVGSGPEQIAAGNSPIAVDPTNGDLLIADSEAHRISRFDSTGTFVSSFDGSGSEGGAFHSILGLAVDSSGEIYVIDNVEGSVEFGGKSVLRRFGADGAADGGNLAANSPKAIAFDPDSGNVIVAGDSAIDFETFNTRPRLYVYNGGEQVVVFKATEDGSGVRALAAGGGSTSRLYVLTESTFFNGSQGVQVLSPITVPTLTFDVPTAITATGVHLSGTVNPVGAQTQYRFEYSTNGIDWNATAYEDPGSGSQPVAVAKDLNDLAPNTDYVVRLEATNAEGEAFTSSLPFGTPLSVPGATTRPASGVTETEATLNGRVEPWGVQATYHFEYGLSTAYGQRVPADYEGVAGNGRKAVPVSLALRDLQPGVTYHYRLVADNSLGRGYGEDRTFTAPAGLSHRAYEMVSPVEKGGAPVRGFPIGATTIKARGDGNSVTYVTQSALPDAESSPLYVRQFAVRGADGWSNSPLDPPALPLAEGEHLIRQTLAISEDQSHVLVASRNKLTPDATEGKVNLYVKDLINGSYHLVSSNAEQVMDNIGLETFIGGTPDFSSVALLFPGDPGSSEIYRWTLGGAFEPASLLPDGTPVHAGPNVANGGHTGAHPMSIDGRRLYFKAREGGIGNGAIYLNENGQSRLVSVSHVPGDPKDPVQAIFDGATADGRFAMFTDTDVIHPLTETAPAASHNVYLYDADQDTLTFLAPDVEQILGVSSDLSYLYYLSQEPPNSQPPGQNLYVYVVHNGERKLVTEVPNNADANSLVAESTDSPNGRYLLMPSRAQLTSYDNSGCKEGGCQEIYFYDAATEELSCASCRTDGKPPTGGATIGREQPSEFEGYYATSVTDSGETFFDTPDPLAVSDVNGTRDVYEYVHGQQRLISDGKTPSVSALADVTPDGRNVFFVTDARLVGQDTDSLNDLYDARVGGGLASQNPAPPEDECTGDCRAATTAPASATLGSESSGAKSGNGPAPRKPRRCTKPKKTKPPKQCAKGKAKSHGKQKNQSRRSSNSKGRQGR